MRETDSDRRIVQLVHQYRLLSQEQIARLMGKSRSRVQQSLIRLYHHEYLERLFLPVWFTGRSPTLYVLAKRGIQLLQGLGEADFIPLSTAKLSPLFLEHTLAMNDFRIALTQACQQREWRIHSWKTENEMKMDYDRVTVQVGKQRAQSVSLIPDSYFAVDVVDKKGLAHFFLELDRGSMTLSRFLTKIHAYIAYYKSGAYERRFGAKGFRVLTVVDTAGKGRVENLLAKTAAINGIGRHFWFAHLSDLTPDSTLFEPIWRVAGDSEPAALFER